MTTVEHHVHWHCADLASSEHAVIRIDDASASQQIRGVAAAPRDDAPAHIEYSIDLVAWHTRRVHVRIDAAGEIVELDVVLAVDGTWTIGGRAAGHLDGCTDIDLGWTPATNTIAMRRLALVDGETAVITAAWVRFPELDILASRQEYTRLAADRWRYQSGPYDYELVVDPGTGLVVAYGDDLWRAVTIRTVRRDELPPTGG
jgi:hypothetical protein